MAYGSLSTGKASSVPVRPLWPKGLGQAVRRVPAYALAYGSWRNRFRDRPGGMPRTIFSPSGPLRLDAAPRGVRQFGQGEIRTVLHPGDGSRAEVIPMSSGLIDGMFAVFHVAYRYEFDVRIEPGTIGAGVPEGIAQWHGIPNRLLGEAYRHAPLLLGIDDGRYFVARVTSPRLVVSTRRAKQRFAAFERLDLGPVDPDLDRWCRWRLDVTWSYEHGGPGRWALYRDHRRVAAHRGPNGFNDLRGGPYLKLGIYRWSQKGGEDRDTVARRYRRIKIRRVAGS